MSWLDTLKEVRLGDLPDGTRYYPKDGNGEVLGTPHRIDSRGGPGVLYVGPDYPDAQAGPTGDHSRVFVEPEVFARLKPELPSEEMGASRKAPESAAAPKLEQYQAEYQPDDRYPFREVAAEVAALVGQKNAAYGDSFNIAGQFIKLLWPDGVPPASYKDMLTMVRMFDKFKRVATMPDAFDEDPRKDVLGYALLWVACSTERMIPGEAVFGGTP